MLEGNQALQLAMARKCALLRGCISASKYICHGVCSSHIARSQAVPEGSHALLLAMVSKVRVLWGMRPS